jgi:hypothetical protein
MYAKGNRPHNKGDSRVDMHYRDKPRMKEKAIPKKKKSVPRTNSYGTPVPWEQSGYYNQLGNNFLKRWF